MFGPEDEIELNGVTLDLVADVGRQFQQEILRDRLTRFHFCRVGTPAEDDASREFAKGCRGRPAQARVLVAQIVSGCIAVYLVVCPVHLGHEFVLQFAESAAVNWRPERAAIVAVVAFGVDFRFRLPVLVLGEIRGRDLYVAGIVFDGDIEADDRPVARFDIVDLEPDDGIAVGRRARAVEYTLVCPVLVGLDDFSSHAQIKRPRGDRIVGERFLIAEQSRCAEPCACARCTNCAESDERFAP